MCNCAYPDCQDGHLPLGYNEETDEVEWGACPQCVVNFVHICELEEQGIKEILK